VGRAVGPGERGPGLSVFADSSALVKLYAEEEGSEVVRGLPPPAGERDRLRSTGDALAEFEADLGGTEDELPRFTVMRVTTSVLEDAAQLVVRHPLRAYDAVQLATAAAARTADPRCSTFACFVDARLSAAASGEKFELLSA